MRPLRVMIYDATWVGSKPDQWFLTTSWVLGGVLYRLLGRIDAVYGATSWPDALAWLGSVEAGRPISQVQYWGHGTRGRVLIARDPLDRRVLEDDDHVLASALRTARDRLTPDALVWFRTCLAFGGARGHAFASACARFFHCRVAGHTYVIGPLQSGLHTLAPGEVPSWPVDEGTAKGDEPRSAWQRLYDAWLRARASLFGGRAARNARARAPSSSEGSEPALMSSRNAPRTITCLDGAIPEGW